MDKVIDQSIAPLSTNANANANCNNNEPCEPIVTMTDTVISKSLPPSPDMCAVHDIPHEDFPDFIDDNATDYLTNDTSWQHDLTGQPNNVDYSYKASASDKQKGRCIY
jgi:hypothetical protein